MPFVQLEAPAEPGKLIDAEVPAEPEKPAEPGTEAKVAVEAAREAQALGPS